MIIFARFLFTLLGRNRTKASTPFPPIIFVNINKKEYFSFTPLKKVEYLKTLNHERIHHEQMRELGLITYYLKYWEYYFENRKTLNKYDAYRKIPFEKEAWSNQGNLTYLDMRQKNAWKSYIY